MADINYLNSITLGKIFSFRSSKSSSIFPVTFPAQDSDEVEGIDTLGVVSYFVVSGYFVGSFQNIQSYIASIRNIIDGYQASVSYFRSPFTNTYVDSNPLRGNIGVNTGTSTNYLVDSSANFTTWNITTGDKVKNLITGVVANVVSQYLETSILLDADIFTSSSTPYAITATMACKLLSLETEFILPGLNYCKYDLNIIQNKDS